MIKIEMNLIITQRKDMKKTLLGIILLIGICSISGSFAKTAIGDIFETQDFVEKTLNISGASINDKLPFTLIKTLFEKECSPTVINDAKATIEQLSQVWGSNIPKRKLEIEMKSRFALLKKLIFSITTKDEALFCKQKYLTYGMLEITQKLFKGENLEITQQNTPENENKAEEKTQSSPDQEHGSAPQKPTLIKLQHFTDNLNSEKEKNFAKISEEVIQEILARMLSQKLLNQEDIKLFDKNIEIHYLKTCEKTKGSFHAIRNKNDKTMQFKGIKLNINLCSSESFEKQFASYVQQIITHEIGHYIYFFKDQKRENFDTICRKEGNKSCKNEDFFSSYAQSNKEEDYAESFAYWYLDTFNGKEKEF